MLHSVWGIERVLVELAASPYEFYLTGSRYFGGATAESDWDFFCEDSPEVRALLQDLNFSVLDWDPSLMQAEVGGSLYGDSNIALVFEHHLGVHIQLQANVTKKKHAQDYLYDSGLMSVHGKSPPSKLDKNQQRKLWNLVYRMMQEG